MQNLTKLIISFFVFSMLWGSCLNTASAKHTNSNIGRAFLTHTPENIKQAKDFNATKIADVQELAPPKRFTKIMRLEKTLGSPNPEAVLHALGNYDYYIKNLRSLESTAGKYFEYHVCESFNTMMRHGKYYAVTTSVLGDSHNAADFLILEKQTNKRICKVQQKLSASEAIRAIFHPEQAEKYKDCIILVPNDQLEYIKRHLHSYSLEKQEKLRKALDINQKFGVVSSPKLTASITVDGITMNTENVAFYLNETSSSKLYKKIFNKISKKILPEAARAIRKGSEFIVVNIKGKKHLIPTSKFIEWVKSGNNVVPTEIEKALRVASKIKNPVTPRVPRGLGNRVLGYTVGVFDVGYGVYMIYDAELKFQRGLLDADLSNYKKILGVVQIGVGVIEIVAESITVIEPIVTPVVIVVSIAIVALDMWIDYIQEQRVAARQRLIERVTARERPEAIRQLLIRDMNIQCAL